MAHRSLALCLLLAAGCASAHDPEEPIATGVYALTIHTASDACSPRRAEGDVGAVGVVRLDRAVSLPVPDGADDRTAEVTGRITLAAADGYYREVVDAMAACPAASVERSYSLVNRIAGGFDVEVVERFSGLGACGPMEGMPLADCEAVRGLEFRLLDRCDAPCEVAWSPATGVECACP